MEGSDPDPSPWHADLFILLNLFGCIGIFVESRGLSGAGYRISVSAGLVACGTWDLSSNPRIKSHPPALQGGFLATGPPGKSQHVGLHVHKAFFCVAVCVQFSLSCVELRPTVIVVVV